MQLNSTYHLKFFLNSMLIMPRIVLFIWHLQCCVYLQTDLLNLINGFFIPYYLTWCLPSFPLVFHKQHLEVKVESIQNMFQKGTSQWKRDYYVIRVLYLDHIFIPRLWTLLIITLEKLYKIIFYYFLIFICLWMEWCRPFELSAHVFPKCRTKYTKKYGIYV